MDEASCAGPWSLADIALFRCVVSAVVSPKGSSNPFPGTLRMLENRNGTQSGQLQEPSKATSKIVAQKAYPLPYPCSARRDVYRGVRTIGSHPPPPVVHVRFE